MFNEQRMRTGSTGHDVDSSGGLVGASDLVRRGGGLGGSEAAGSNAPGAARSKGSSNGGTHGWRVRESGVYDFASLLAVPCRPLSFLCRSVAAARGPTARDVTSWMR